MNLQATRRLARQIAHRLQKNNGGVVLLHGVMGAGKTTLVGEIVKILSPDAMPASPTYTMINQYAEKIFHADLYRLWERDGQALDLTADEVRQAAESIGLFDLCVPGNYVFIEWGKDLQFTGVDQMEITIQVKEDGKREFIID